MRLLVIVVAAPGFVDPARLPAELERFEALFKPLGEGWQDGGGQQQVQRPQQQSQQPRQQQEQLVSHSAQQRIAAQRQRTVGGAGQQQTAATRAAQKLDGSAMSFDEYKRSGLSKEGIQVRKGSSRWQTRYLSAGGRRSDASSRVFLAALSVT